MKNYPVYIHSCHLISWCAVTIENAHAKFTLSSTGSILSNTDLSDLSTVGTCDIFVYQMRHRVM